KWCTIIFTIPLIQIVQRKVEKLLMWSALSYGPGAAALMYGRGVVCAVFSNGIYLQDESGNLAGLVDSQKADGPITIRVSGLAAALPVLSSMVGARFEGDGSTLNIGGRLVIDMAKA